MKIFFYDLETTGVLVHKNGIHQISGAISISGVIHETFDFKARPNPNAVIDPEALAIAGVTIDQIMQYRDMYVVYLEVIGLIAKYIDKFNSKDKFYLCGFNNKGFDDQFFRGFFLQNGDKFFGSYFYSNSLDVMALATPLLMDKRQEMPDFKLKTVARFLGVPVDETKLHDAAYDIDITMKSFDAIMGRILAPIKELTPVDRVLAYVKRNGNMTKALLSMLLAKKLNETMVNGVDRETQQIKAQQIDESIALLRSIYGWGDMLKEYEKHDITSADHVATDPIQALIDKIVTV